MHVVAQCSPVSVPGAGVRFLRFSELKEKYNHPWSRMHTDREEKAGRFPRRVPLGPNSVGWIETEYVAWQLARIAARDQPTQASDTPAAQPNQIIVADDRGRVRTLNGQVAATIRRRITDSL